MAPIAVTQSPPWAANPRARTVDADGAGRLGRLPLAGPVLAHLAPRHPERGDRRPAELAGAGEVAPGGGGCSVANAVANAAANSPPIAPGRLPSSWPIERSAASGTRLSQCSGSAAARRVDQAAVQLRGAGQAGPAALGNAAPPERGHRARSWPPWRRGRRSRGARPAGRAGRSPGPRRRSAGRGRIRRAPPRSSGARASRAAATPSTSDRTSCWAWSSSPSARAIEAPNRVRVCAEAGEHIRLLPAHELGSGHGDGWRDFDRGEQFGERIRFRRVVVGEQPQPLVGRRPWPARCAARAPPRRRIRPCAGC